MRLGDLDALEAEFVQMGTVLHSTDTACAAAYVVNKAPTVEAAPVVHGTWDMFGCCNQCGYGDEKQGTQYIQENYKYCPNCAAKMDL